MNAPFKEQMRYKPGQTCSVSGCERLAKAKGYCNVHYQRVCDKGHAGPAVLIYDAAYLSAPQWKNSVQRMAARIRHEASTPTGWETWAHVKVNSGRKRVSSGKSIPYRAPETWYQASTRMRKAGSQAIRDLRKNPWHSWVSRKVQANKKRFSVG